MSNKRKDDRKKKKRQEKIRLKQQQKKSRPAAKLSSPWQPNDENVPSFDDRTYAKERLLREWALESGIWIVDQEMINQASDECAKTGRVTWIGDSDQGPAAERAQELAYSALETDHPPEICQLAGEALKLHPDCLDAQLALFIGQSSETRAQHLSQLHALGEQALRSFDQSLFAVYPENGNFLLQARPYLRIQQALYYEYVATKQFDLAFPILARLLVLDFDFGCDTIENLFHLLGEDQDWSHLDALLPVLPSHHDLTLLIRGLLAFRQNDLVKAKAHFLQAYQQAPRLEAALEDAPMTFEDDEEDENEDEDENEVAAARAFTLVNTVTPIIEDTKGFTDWIQRSMPVMAAQEINSHLATYSKPVATLLTLEDADIDSTTVLDYHKQFDLHATHRLELERMLADTCFSQELTPNHPARWAPTHAWRALIQINDPASIPALIAYLCDDLDELAFEKLPEAIGAFGTIAMPNILAALEKNYVNEFIPGALMRALIPIAKADVNARSTIIERLEKTVLTRRRDWKLIRTSAALSLSQLGSVASLPAITKAYEEGAMNEGFCSLKFIQKCMRDHAVG
jgi:hypothetical protein